MQKEPEIWIHDTTLHYCSTREGIRREKRNEKYSHFSYFYKILNMLKGEGFQVEKDPEIAKMYKIISKDHWYGRRGDLEFTAEKYPAGFTIMFFQNVNILNKNGGKYDFDKLVLMPHQIRLQYTLYMRKVVDMLKTLTSVKDITRPVAKTAEEQIKNDLVFSWHFYPDTNFNLSKIKEPGSYYGLDRDKKQIHNGDLKYFRDSWNGYIMRGRVYYRANMQYWAIINDRKAVIVEHDDLFDDFPAGEPRRKAPDRTPRNIRELQQKRESAKAEALDLIARLENHGVKVTRKARRACINEIFQKTGSVV